MTPYFEEFTSGRIATANWTVREMAINPKDYNDSREIPRYGVSEAALYLGIARSTLRAWVLGRHYATKSGSGYSAPIIDVAQAEDSDPLLSFYNLAEVYVLSSLRLGHEVKLKKIRSAVEWLRAEYPVVHPLLSHEFFTDGIDVFVKKLLGRKIATINASARGQIAISDIVNPYLHRIERDERGLTVKVFPSIPKVDSPRIISMAPNVAAGRPAVDSTGVRASVIWNRYSAGESVVELSEDYEIQQEEVQAAIQYVRSITSKAA